MLTKLRTSVIINSLRSRNIDYEKITAACLQPAFTEKSSISFTEYHGHAIQLAADAADAGYNCIIAIGGDGTFNEVVNGADPEKNQHIIFGLIPAGTGNDFYKSIGRKFSIVSFVQSLQNKVIHNYDTGVLTVNGTKRFFLNVADAGFGGHAAVLLDNQRAAGLKGGLSYSVAILRAFFSFSKPVVSIVYDHDKVLFQGRMMMLAVCNGNTFGNGLIICPDAMPDDGILGICIIGDVRIWDYLKNYFNLMKGKKINHPDVHYSSANEISVQIHQGDAMIEADGELTGSGDCSFRVLPGLLKMIET
jgi:diacylglycerol kinase (ATP)